MRKFVIIIFCLTLCFIQPICASGEIRIYDARYARQILRASAQLEEELPEYDLNEDGNVTAQDARLALRRAAKLPDYELIIVETTSMITTTTEPTTVVTTTEKHYSQVGVLSTCGLTEGQLYNGLKRNLKQYAWAFLEAEKQYNVNAVFLAAVAALESGWGTSSVARNRNNFFGWKGSGDYMYFDTPADGIMHVAKFLKKNYLTPGGSCFHGYEVEDVQRCYCPGGDWARQVRGIMNTIRNGAH